MCTFDDFDDFRPTGSRKMASDIVSSNVRNFKFLPRDGMLVQYNADVMCLSVRLSQVDVLLSRLIIDSTEISRIHYYSDSPSVFCL